MSKIKQIMNHQWKLKASGQCIGGAMVKRTCSNGYVICKNLGLSLTYDQWSFSAITRLLSLTNQTPVLRYVPCALINYLKAIRNTCKAPEKNKEKP